MEVLVDWNNLPWDPRTSTRRGGEGVLFPTVPSFFFTELKCLNLLYFGWLSISGVSLATVSLLLFSCVLYHYNWKSSSLWRNWCAVRGAVLSGERRNRSGVSGDFHSSIYYKVVNFQTLENLNMHKNDSIVNDLMVFWT